MRWVRKFARTDELGLDLVPRGPGRDRPVVYALWVDSAPLRLLERFRPRPNLVVEHSEGAFGAWQLSQPLRAARALDALHDLAAALDGDPEAASLDHRARVPGTLDGSGAAVVAVDIDLRTHTPESLQRAVSARLEAA